MNKSGAALNTITIAFSKFLWR